MKIKHNQDEFLSYLEDSSALKGGHAQGLYIPETYEDVANILKKHTDEKIPLTISGNGTGTTGARIPFGGYILSTSPFNKILEINTGKKFITVQAGVLLQTVQDSVEELQLFYPPDPTERMCFIGATISNNSSGARTYRYGATRDWVKRIKIAMPTGEIIDIPRGKYFADDKRKFDITLDGGNRLVFQMPSYNMPNITKHTTGYFAKPNMDLIDLFIGSEGTLGVILEADLNLISLPKKILSYLFYFENTDELLNFIDDIKQNHNENIGSIEYFDKNSLDFLRNKFPSTPHAEGAILIEEIFDEEVTDDDVLTIWIDIISKYNIIDSVIALSKSEQTFLKDFRHALPAQLSEWFSKYKQKKVSTDMCVSDLKFKELFNLYICECRANCFIFVLFGHIGNSHLHLNIMPKNDEEAERAKNVYQSFIKKTMSLQGTISAEHGIGKIKSHLLHLMFSETHIHEMLQIKKIFDPHFILNRGNLFSENTLNNF